MWDKLSPDWTTCSLVLLAPAVPLELMGLLAGEVEGRPGMAMRLPATNSLGSLMLLSCSSRLVVVPNRSANSDTVSPFLTVYGAVGRGFAGAAWLE